MTELQLNQDYNLVTIRNVPRTIETLSLISTGVNINAILNKTKNLNYLNIRDPINPASLNQIDLCSVSVTLEFIILVSYIKDHLVPYMFMCLTKLQSIWIDSSDSLNIQDNLVFNSTNPVNVWITRSNLNELDIAESGLDKNINYITLDLHGNNITSSNEKFFKHIVEKPNINITSLENNPINCTYNSVSWLIYNNDNKCRVNNVYCAYLNSKKIDWRNLYEINPDEYDDKPN